jgi:hypothetical protein
MKSHRISLITLAIVTALVSAFALATPSAQAVGFENVVLYGYDVSAAGQSATACSYKVTVEDPGVISLEDDYLNMTIYGEPTGNGAAAHMTLKVLVYLYDGTTNVSLGNKSLAMEDDSTYIWANLSYNDVGMAAFLANGTALLSVELWFLNTTPAPDDYQMVDYYQVTFGIYATAVGAAIMQFVPLIISVAILSAIIPMFKKMGGGKGRSGGHTKTHKKR